MRSVIDMGEVASLVASLKARMTLELQSRFDWDAIEQEQGKFELKSPM